MVKFHYFTWITAYFGESNKCYPTCKVRCQNDKTYYLKDRLNVEFEIMPDNIQTVTTLFNSKTTSISPRDFQVDFARIDILHILKQLLEK